MIKRSLSLLATAFLISGCTGPLVEGTIFEHTPRTDPEVARVVGDTRQMNLEFRQLTEQVSALARNQEMLEARLARIEAQSPSNAQPNEELTALRRDLQLLRAERESLRSEITGDLAGRIEKIAARQQAEINAARSATAAAVSQSKAAARGSGYEHKVERGQTLSEIARGYGKSVDTIMKANGISNPSMLRVGQVLFIPD